MDFEKLSDDELVQSYGSLLKELKRRGIIRSKNIVGDLGEYIAIRHYNTTPGLPKLQAAPPGTQNVDALSRTGDRYSIKSITGNVTGVFYGLPPKGSDETPEKKFEFVIIVVFNNDYTVKRIIELIWAQFLEFKRWHSRMNAWNVPINKEVLEKAKTIYSTDGAS